MKIYSRFLILLFFFMAFFPPPLSATTKIGNLIDYIQQSLNQTKENISLNPISKTTETIYKIQKEFYELPRHQMSYEELLETKSLMQHWRFHTKKKLIESLFLMNPSKQKYIIILLARLDIVLSIEELKQIKKTLLQKSLSMGFDSNLWDRFDLLVQYQGDSKISQKFSHTSLEDPISGPSKRISIHPIAPSSWPFTRWSKIKEFENYYRSKTDESQVYFRGHFFENGDIIVVNQFNNMDGVFSTFPKGPSSFSHAAIYVEMEKNGKKYPSIFEMHKHGTRLVPLNIFFSKKFISYAEVYRINQGPFDWKKRLPDLINRIDKRPHGYNLYAQTSYSRGDRYLTCTQLVEYVLRQANALTYFNQCEIVPSAQTLLKQIGFNATSVLTPTSFIKNPYLKLVGAFDSSTLTHNIAKEIVLSRFSNDIDANNFAITNFKKTKFYQISEKFQKKFPWLSDTLLRFGGNFTNSSIPIGPIGVLSITPPLDEYAAKSLKKVKKELKKELHQYLDQGNKPFLISEFLANNEVKIKLKKIFLFFEIDK